MKLSMKQQRFKLIIFCSNDNPVLILTYFTARSNFATSAFIWENVTMMDTLEIISSCDLKFGLRGLSIKYVDFPYNSGISQYFKTKFR